VFPQDAAAPIAETSKKSHRLSRFVSSVAAHAFTPLAKQNVPGEYEEFFRAMNLDPEKQRRTQDILIDWGAAEQFVVVKALLRGQHPGSGYKPKTTEERNELIRDRDKKLAEILSPEELAKLIPIRFQNETNCATICSWQDQSESTRSWCRKLKPLSRKLRICKSCEQPSLFFFRLCLEPRWNKRPPCSAWGGQPCPGYRRDFANGATRVAFYRDSMAGVGTYS
jgi:hypothetical protein